ncbi:hypothetical protein EA187_16330 [Lujinxingia sediminis]|uniref:Uncharacterized protein n=1 Tax=Lujinxingia sediminis TaxID=2480984 RepID=A0ABY0CPP7_9DELT|nr:hypothetical protein [Lujinxingia sediminis]RVU42443.1 hypothetical protein EA187_16330 [Lujinxingia sediminis]
MSAGQRKQNPNLFRALELGAILLSFGVLYVGMTVASGLESVAAEWGAKILAVVVLAGLFTAVRLARQRDALLGMGAASLDGELSGEAHDTSDSEPRA